MKKKEKNVTVNHPTLNYQHLPNYKKKRKKHEIKIYWFFFSLFTSLIVRIPLTKLPPNLRHFTRFLTFLITTFTSGPKKFRSIYINLTYYFNETKLSLLNYYLSLYYFSSSIITLRTIIFLSDSLISTLYCFPRTAKTPNFLSSQPHAPRERTYTLLPSLPELH